MCRLSTPLEKDEGLERWIRVGVSLSASGDFAALMVLVWVLVMAGVMSIAQTSRVPKRIIKPKRKKLFKGLLGLGFVED